MASKGCGCKICKSELGEVTNEMILEGSSPFIVLKELEDMGCKVSERTLKKHLKAYEIEYPKQLNQVEEVKPIKVDLNKIDFSEYELKLDEIQSVIAYIQKINIKVFLNQSLITLQAQQDVINGDSPSVPKEILQNLAVAYQILSKSTGFDVHVNQQEAIKAVEAMGLTIQNQLVYVPDNVQSHTQPKTN